MSDELIPPPEGEQQLSTDPKRKLESIFEKMEMMAYKQSEGGVDIKAFTDSQKV